MGYVEYVVSTNLREVTQVMGYVEVVSTPMEVTEPGPPASFFHFGPRVQIM